MQKKKKKKAVAAAKLSAGLFLNTDENRIYLCGEMSLFHLQKCCNTRLYNKHKHVGPCLTANQSDYSEKNVHKEFA